MSTTSQPLLHTHANTPSHHRTLLLILSLLAILASSALLAVHFFRPSPSGVHSSFGNLCHKAEDQSSCLALVSEVVASSGGSFDNDPRSLLELFVKRSALWTQKAVGLVRDADRKINDPREHAALGDCVELLEMSVDRMRDAVASLKESV